MTSLSLLLAQPGDRVVPPFQVDFRDSLGFVGAREPVCADGCPARPPGFPWEQSPPVAVPGVPVREGPVGASERI